MLTFLFIPYCAFYGIYAIKNNPGVSLEALAKIILTYIIMSIIVLL